MLANGWLVSSKGHGRWGLRGGVRGGDIVFKICSKEIRLLAHFEPTGWRLTSADPQASLEGALETPPPGALDAWNLPLHLPLATTISAELESRVSGSGPYMGRTHGEIYLLRAGVLFAKGPHSRLRSWRAIDSHRLLLSPRPPKQMVGGGGSADEAAADQAELLVASHGGGGAGTPVVVGFLDCFVMRFLHGGNSSRGAPLPARYGASLEYETAEWIIRPQALFFSQTPIFSI